VDKRFGVVTLMQLERNRKAGVLPAPFYINKVLTEPVNDHGVPSPEA
jgi:hypothetical protein